jgi:hypothetical protein
VTSSILKNKISNSFSYVKERNKKNIFLIIVLLAFISFKKLAEINFVNFF